MTTRRALFGNASAIAVLLCFPLTSAAETPAGMLVVAQSIDIIVNDFDPAEVYEVVNEEIFLNIYRNLVSVDREDSSKVNPDLAESWIAAEDGKSVTFRLREGIVFASGNPVTAEDTAFSLHRLIKLGRTPSGDFLQLGWSPENIEGLVTAADDRTLMLTTFSAPIR